MSTEPLPSNEHMRHDLIRLACSCSERQVRRRPNNFQKILERRFQKLRARVYTRNKRIGSVRHEAEDIKGSGKLQWSREKSVRETSLSLVFLCPGRRTSCKIRCSLHMFRNAFLPSLISHDTRLLQILMC